MPPPPPAPPVALFPPAPTLTLAENVRLKNAVATAVSGVVRNKPGNPAAQFSVTLIEAGSKAVGGFEDDDEHYSASIVKTGVIYAAHALLDMVTRYNALRSPSSPAALFDGLRKEMNPAIIGSSSLIRAGTVRDEHRLPNYEKVFAISKAGARLMVDFHGYFRKALDLMPESDAQASVGIRGLGYSYINGALEKARFFRPRDKKGVWVGGDFGGWPQVRIPCDNDGDTAQGTTSRTIAHLVAVILLDKHLPTHSHDHLIDWLKKSAHGKYPSLFIRSDVPGALLDNQVTHGKIGVGELGRDRKGPTVYSEASMLKGLGKDYVASFVNVNYKQNYTISDVIDVIKEAIRLYEAPGAVPAP